MSFRAKFTVNSITDFGPNYQGKTVTMSPVYSDSKEDRSFALYTPSATLTMTVDNPVVMEELKIGTTFYVDFTPVDAA